VAPYSAADAKGLLKSAIRDPNPVVFLENELLYGRPFELPEQLKDPETGTLPLGKAEIIREGQDVTVAAFSITVATALEAAEILSHEGIDVEVINLRTLRPLDTETIIRSVIKTNRLVTIEEGWPFAGIGAEISAMICEEAFDYLDAQPLRICAEDVPLPYAANLEKLALPSRDKLIRAIKTVCYR
jgi:pyruvate dehydrogenase E1 component beta subunit